MPTAPASPTSRSRSPQAALGTTTATTDINGNYTYTYDAPGGCGFARHRRHGGRCLEDTDRDRPVGFGKHPARGRSDQLGFGVGQSERGLDEFRVDQQPHRDPRPVRRPEQCRDRPGARPLRPERRSEQHRRHVLDRQQRHLLRCQRRRLDGLHPRHEVEPDQRRDDPCLLRHQRLRGLGLPEPGDDHDHRRVRSALRDDRQQRQGRRPVRTTSPTSRKFVVLVVDASGRPRPTSTSFPRSTSTVYWKGFIHRGSSRVGPEHSTAGGCVNEDINRNGVLEAVRGHQSQRRHRAAQVGRRRLDPRHRQDRRLRNGDGADRISAERGDLGAGQDPRLGDRRQRHRRARDLDRGAAGSGDRFHATSAPAFSISPYGARLQT